MKDAILTAGNFVIGTLLYLVIMAIAGLAFFGVGLLLVSLPLAYSALIVLGASCLFVKLFAD